MIWHQGESDANLTADQYERLLTAFIARVRADLEAPDLPFGVGEVYDNPGAKIRPDPAKDEHFTVHIGSAGVGPGSFAYLSYDRVPSGVFPVVEVEYPAAVGASPVRERYELKQRC